MRLTPTKLVVPQDDPFKNDALSRKNSAEALTELLRSCGEPLVLCVNAGWGFGKTTFLYMWRQQLKNCGFRTLMFNAWESDFTDDAFVAIIGELELGINELSLDRPTKSVADEHLQKLKKFGGAIIKRGLPVAVKLITAGILAGDEFTEEALSDAAEKLAVDQIKAYEKSKTSVAGFKQALRDFANDVSDADGPDKLPLVVMIDELDRCRPTYAIKVLEAVKHFFSVENVVFVLALDREQLGHSVRGAYGSETDVAGYLRRFIDIDFNLPRPRHKAFVAAQFARYDLADAFKERDAAIRQTDYHDFREVFSAIAKVLDCSPREIERAFTLLTLALRLTPKNHLLYPMLLGPLILLKIKCVRRPKLNANSERT